MGAETEVVMTHDEQMEFDMGYGRSFGKHKKRAERNIRGIMTGRDFQTRAREYELGKAHCAELFFEEIGKSEVPTAGGRILRYAELLEQFRGVTNVDEHFAYRVEHGFVSPEEVQEIYLAAFTDVGKALRAKS